MKWTESFAENLLIGGTAWHSPGIVRRNCRLVLMKPTRAAWISSAGCNSIEMMILEGYTHFISGGALGMDMYAAEAVLTLREQYPEITLEIAIPHDGQTAKWPQSLRDRAERIREEADVITWIAHEYTKRCLFDRNYYMVSHCSVLLACFDGQPGGTAQTIETAHRLGRLITGVRAGPG